jgi:hypothetical protein
MSEITERLKTAIAERYVIERELGEGGSTWRTTSSTTARSRSRCCAPSWLP